MGVTLTGLARLTNTAKHNAICGLAERPSGFTSLGSSAYSEVPWLPPFHQQVSHVAGEERRRGASLAQVGVGLQGGVVLGTVVLQDKGFR